MGTNIELTTADGHTLGAYKAEPEGTPKGGVVVIQEIFGVNQHIKNVTDEFAKNGYVAIARLCSTASKRVLSWATARTIFRKAVKPAAA